MSYASIHVKRMILLHILLNWQPYLFHKIFTDRELRVYGFKVSQDHLLSPCALLSFASFKTIQLIYFNVFQDHKGCKVFQDHSLTLSDFKLYIYSFMVLK